jgi:RNA polymerase sigma-70 factor, ECF subfamily
MTEAAAEGAAGVLARHAAENAARVSYGRLLAFLVSRSRDVAGSEDALAEAFAAALTTWPLQGVPASPEAWLMTAAKRNLLMVARHRTIRDAFAEAERHVRPEADERVGDEEPIFPDDRLKLLFACAHPAVDPAMHVPLMLQTVLGLEARQIAQALLVSPSAMAQRLVRTKAALREARVPIAIPGGDELGPRLFAVLEAIYALYGLSLDGISVAGDEANDLRREALYLARLVASLLPDEPEPLGLVALVLFCESRTLARRSPAGAFVPLHAQDVARWDRAQIDEAEQLLVRASAHRRPGPLQLEAAIQSAHTHRAFTGKVPWAGIAQLYEALLVCAPSIGSQIGHAVAVGESRGPREGLRLLAALDASLALDRGLAQQLAAHQPFWVARAEFAFRAGDHADAIAWQERAIGLSERPEIRAYLWQRLELFRQ